MKNALIQHSSITKLTAYEFRIYAYLCSQCQVLTGETVKMSNPEIMEALGLSDKKYFLKIIKSLEIKGLISRSHPTGQSVEYYIRPLRQIAGYVELYDEYDNYSLISEDTILRLSPAELHIFATLLSYVYSNNVQCFPSKETLAKQTGLSVRTVFNSTEKLEELGLLTKKRRKNQSNLYIIRHMIKTKKESTFLSPSNQEIQAYVRKQKTNIDKQGKTNKEITQDVFNVVSCLSNLRYIDNETGEIFEGVAVLDKLVKN